MGQKINPIGLRLGINRTWDSRWFAGKQEYGKLLHEDVKIREILHKELKQAAVARIVIERPHKKCRVTIHSARPGVVIGKKGADIDKLRKKVADITSSDVVINIVEIRKPELDATLVAESIAQQLERRVAFRRAMAKKSSVEKNNRRKRMAKNAGPRREKLKAIIADKTKPMEERFAATLKLAEMPRNSSPTRIRNRCELTGRPRSNYRKNKLSRIALRELGSKGLVPGLVKSSW